MKYNIKKAMSIKYKKARKYEKYRDYTSAIYLYEKIIKKSKNREISSPAKVRIAELYLDGKSKKIDNEYARKLLEDAYNQGNMDSEGLLGYMCAVGIGGKKDIDKARKLLLSAYENNNPEPMVYIELAKLLPRDKKNKEFKKNLLNSVSFREKIKYNRKKSIDKLNNHKLGKIINYIPNLVKFKLQEYYIIDIEDKNFPYTMNDLYEKAKDLYDAEKYSNSRVIFKRLAGYGDEESSIKYAKMAFMGIGGEKDIDSAKTIYEDIIRKYDNKILNLNRKIDELIKSQKEESSLIISRRKKEKNEEFTINKVKELKQEIKQLRNNSIYNKAMLNYGLLMVDNYKTQEELNTGIEFLQTQVIYGELVTNGKWELNKSGRDYNKRAKIAIKRLGKLYESGEWIPQNPIYASETFSRFRTGEIADYASKISKKISKSITPEMYLEEKEKNKRLQIQRSEKIKEEFKISTHVKDKKCNFRFALGRAFQNIGFNRLARNMYESMVDRGDFRASYSLGIMKKDGIGGRKDNIKAMKSFAEYSAYVTRMSEEDNSEILTDSMRRNKFRAENNIGNILLEMKDYVGAIERFKISAKGGLKPAKSALISLFQQGIWIPNIFDEFEMALVRPKELKKSSNTVLKQEKKKNIPKAIPKALKPIAASVAATVALSGAIGDQGYLNEDLVTGSKKTLIDYVIGDEVKLSNDNENNDYTIIGVIAYNPKDNFSIVKNDYSLYQYGLSFKNYVDEKSLSEIDLKPLYCIKDSSGRIKWINPEEQEMVVSKHYSMNNNAIKKSEDLVIE